MATSLRIALVRFHKWIVALLASTAAVVLASQIHLAGQFLITPGFVHDVSEIVELASPHSGNPKNLNLVTVKSVTEPSILQTVVDVVLNNGELRPIPKPLSTLTRAAFCLLSTECKAVFSQRHMLL